MGVSRDCPICRYSLLSQERVKVRTKFVGTFIALIGQKPLKMLGMGIIAVARGRRQGVPKVFRAPMYRVHCAVIFAIAQISCLFWPRAVDYLLIVFDYVYFGITTAAEITTDRISADSTEHILQLSILGCSLFTYSCYVMNYDF